MGMKILTVGLIIISALVMSSAILTSSAALHASSKGLKLYLTIDTDLPSQDITIDTEQFGQLVYGHDGLMNTGINEYTLEYPSGLVENGDFRICVTTVNNDWYNCADGYNSKEKKPEHVFVNLVRNQEVSNSPNVQGQSQSQTQTLVGAK